MSFFNAYVSDNYSIIVLSAIALLLLVMKPKVSNVDFRPMYITIVCIVLCSILDKAETFASYDSSLYIPRLILSVLCYWLRPMFCMGVIYVIVTNTKKRILIAIPQIINIVVMGLAFVPGVCKSVFYFNEKYTFCRGPLGYSVFVVGFLYLFFLLYLVLFKLREKMAKETIILAVCSFSVVVSTILETMGRLQYTTPKLVLVSCLVYYLTIYIQLTSVDALTGLYNRENYYIDLKKGRITAIASIDMNGLKELNDSTGHECGDLALATIAKAISDNTITNSRGYRTGGDEFVIIFKKADETKVKTVCENVKKSVEEAGYSVAVGYVVSKGETVKELISISDERMYADKQAYYSRAKSRSAR